MTLSLKISGRPWVSPSLLLLLTACVGALEATAQPFPLEFVSEQVKMVAPDSRSYQQGFGSGVAIDGDHLAVAAVGDDDAGENAGAVYLFRREGGAWIYVRKLTPSGQATSFLFGSSIAMANGVLAIGVPGFGDAPVIPLRPGAIELYVREGNDWFFDRRLEGDDNSAVGYSLAFDGVTLVTGSPSFPSAGEAHVYHHEGQNWRYLSRLRTPNAPGPSFGENVTVEGDTIVVGDRGLTVQGVFGAGAAHVFEWDGGAWRFAQTLDASDKGNNDQFGSGAAVAGDTLVIGTGGINRPYGRAVHIFQRTGGAWVESAVLSAQLFNDPPIRSTTQGRYAIAISPDQNLIFAGMPEEPQPGNTNNPGAVLVFKRKDGQWTGARRLGGDPRDFEEFGWALDFDGQTLVVSDLQDDIGLDPGWYGSTHVFAVDLVSSDENAVDRFLRAQLYRESASGSDCCSPEDAAFRYKVQLYESSTNGPTPTPEALAEHYLPSDRNTVERVLAEVRNLLRAKPASALYQDLLLDIYYDRLVADAILAQGQLQNLDRNRLLRIGTPPTRMVIDDEIADYEAALPPFRDALRSYLDLWKEVPDPASAAAEPVGLTAFRARGPVRPLMTAQYLDQGTIKPVAGDAGTPLSSGFRDAILLLEALGEYGRTTAAYSRLLALAGTGDSVSRARALLGAARQLILVHGWTVLGIVRSAPEIPEELEDALAQWRQAAADLAELEAHLESGLNSLGFYQDFFVLFNLPQGADPGLFDTFNILRERLDNRDSNANQIVRAVEAQEEAIEAFETFIGGQEEIEERLVELTADARLRLLQIVGAEFDSEVYRAVPGPNSGEDGGFVRGSELWQQHRNVQRARLNILRNSSEISNLHEKVRIEASRNLFEVETQNAIAQIQIRYGDQRADIQEEIGHLNAAQKGAESLAGALNPANWGEVIGNALNAGVQVGAEIRKNELEAEKERLAAKEQSEIIARNNEILNANSTALIKTWLLDMNIMAIDSQENALLLQQEIGRLIALFREKAALERRIQRHDTRLSRRYFADPVHRLRYLQQFHRANQRFEEARQTIYFAAKALEYKWNEPFDTIMAGSGITLATLYQVRNASELQQLIDAMELEDFRRNTPDRLPQEFTDVFSLRDDAFGFNGTPQGIAAFRDFLRDHLQGDLNRDAFVSLELQFSTVRDPLRGFDGDNFFRGPRLELGANGTATVLRRGNYLDKIRALQISIPGTHTLGPTTLSGSLTYAGTGFIRRREVGRPDPMRPDRLINEMASFPTRVASSEATIWSSADSLSVTATIALGTVPSGAPILALRERSVAASNWTLSLVVKDGTPRVDLDEIDDIRLHFTHQAVARQN